MAGQTPMTPPSHPPEGGGILGFWLGLMLNKATTQYFFCFFSFPYELPQYEQQDAAADCDLDPSVLSRDSLLRSIPHLTL